VAPLLILLQWASISVEAGIQLKLLQQLHPKTGVDADLGKGNIEHEWTSGCVLTQAFRKILSLARRFSPSERSPSLDSVVVDSRLLNL